MKLFVRNLSYSATSQDLRSLFDKLGYVVLDAKVILSPEDGRSRGFGFVTVETDGPAAILDANGLEYMDRVLQVMQAEEKRPRKSSSGGRRRDMTRSKGFSWEDV